MRSHNALFRNQLFVIKGRLLIKILYINFSLFWSIGNSKELEEVFKVVPNEYFWQCV
jgi:arginine decarboxylase-like protein